MVKKILNTIFSKKINQKAVASSVPVFKITQPELIESDFEVSEISYAEYAKFENDERRQITRPVVYDQRNPTGLSRAIKSASLMSV
ncbi:MAG: hypothetical protein Q8M99_03070 [Methylotenera sp.]|nr:hypothetical protein [Methylotenera sp.]